MLTKFTISYSDWFSVCSLLVVGVRGDKFACTESSELLKDIIRVASYSNEETTTHVVLVNHFPLLSRPQKRNGVNKAIVILTLKAKCVVLFFCTVLLHQMICHH